MVISPAIAEMLDRLDLADRIVGIGQFGPWPETLEDLPVVGGYDNPNVEQVIELGTDAVLNVKSQGEGIRFMLPVLNHMLTT
ncbi:MAG: ABC transporter substrate-binding protein [Gammaproteobacteria bacterium]